MPETHFDEWLAQRYETLWPELFDPAVLNPTVDFLADLAGTGPALELGVGTGRIALPLSRRGIRVHGIELSPAMVTRLQAEVGGSEIGVTIGDFATAEVAERFTLVYISCATRSRTLRRKTSRSPASATPPRIWSPAARSSSRTTFPSCNASPPGSPMRVFTATPTHIGIEEYDVAAQIAVSRHFWVIDGQLKTFSSPHRYVWAAELDLMARFAGLELQARWGGWNHEPFTSESRHHISVWRKGA